MYAYLIGDMDQYSYFVAVVRRLGRPYLVFRSIGFVDALAVDLVVLQIVEPAAVQSALVTLDFVGDPALFHLSMKLGFDHTNYCYLDCSCQSMAVSSVTNYRLIFEIISDKKIE